MPRRTAVLVGALAVACGSLALGAALGAAGPVVVPTEGPWVVQVEGPSAGDGECAADPAVDYAVTPAIMPPVGTSFGLAPDATRADLERVVACLERYVSTSRISVVSTGTPTAP
ncbi:hypothetical protein [Oerskovia sp. KBS0722]|uniref:hypothetical protein n=1 Tax=Oerskovia sp. KBS0722 TaxID=1179673 RepID=UPI00110E86DE|nr:hypothetical protein [Oerskovia sp. KBS0722]QDW63133.1 hypothetical protein FFI11_011920 [Oerskovia sp. KBS0722]